jgi:hypothetical protein
VCDDFAVLTSKNFYIFLHSMPELIMCEAVHPSTLGFHDVRSFGFNSNLLSPPCILIYLLTAIGLSPGGSTHLHTNTT